MICTWLGPMPSPPPPYSYYWCRAFDIAAAGTNFNVFSYNAVWVKYRTIKPESEQRGRLRALASATDAGFPLIYYSFFHLKVKTKKKIPMLSLQYSYRPPKNLLTIFKYWEKIISSPTEEKCFNFNPFPYGLLSLWGFSYMYKMHDWFYWVTY